MKRPLLLFLILVVAFTSCVSTINWQLDPYALYPKDKYVCAIGVAADSLEADLNAKKELISLFGLSVKSYTQRIIKEWEDELESSYEDYFVSSIEVEVDIDDLYGVEIVKRGQNKDKFVSLAVMKKKATQDYYLAQIESMRDELNSFEKRVGENENSFEALQKVREHLSLASEFNKRVVIYNYLSDGVIEFYNIANIRNRYEQIKSSTSLSLEAIGDDNKTVSVALAKVLTDAGFAIALSSEDPTAKISLTINWQKIDGIGNLFVYAQYDAEISIVDVVSAKKVFVYKASGREGHQEYSGAKIRSEKALVKSLEEQLAEQFIARYGH